jgi:hypothetical protein
MNRFLGPSAFGLSALALAVALWGSRGEPEAPVLPSETPSASSSPELRELERRVKSLEDNALSLSKRLMLLEQRPVTSSDGGQVAVAPGALAAEVEQLRTEVRGLLAGEALSSEGGREYLKDMVRSVQDEMRTEQRQVRLQQVQQAQAQARAESAERWRQFASEARLSYAQEQQLTSRLKAEDTRREALLEELRAGTRTPQQLRQELRELRTQTDTEMKAILDETQQAKYDELRREEWRRSRPRGWQGGGQP